MDDHEVLIDVLSRSVKPVKRLAPTSTRVLLWMVLALPSGILVSLGLHHGWTDWSQPAALWPFASMVCHLLSAPWVSRLHLNSESPGGAGIGWPLFVPVVVAWLFVAVMNIVNSPHPIGQFGSGMYCFSFMTISSLPMVVLAVLLLRRSRAFNPGKTLAAAGLGAAFTASALLMLCHSTNEEVFDFGMHLAAGLLIIGSTVLVGRRWVAA